VKIKIIEGSSALTIAARCRIAQKEIVNSIGSAAKIVTFEPRH